MYIQWRCIINAAYYHIEVMIHHTENRQLQRPKYTTNELFGVLNLAVHLIIYNINLQWSEKMVFCFWEHKQAAKATFSYNFCSYIQTWDHQNIDFELYQETSRLWLCGIHTCSFSLSISWVSCSCLFLSPFSSFSMCFSPNSSVLASICFLASRILVSLTKKYA